MLSLRCSGTGCGFATGEYETAVSIALLNNHTTVVHSGQSTQPEAQRAPKVERPVLSDSLSEEHWNGFLKSWTVFVQANSVSVADRPIQLFACCDSELRSKVTCTNEGVLDCTVYEILELLHTLSVLPVAIGVQRSELLKATTASR